MRFLENSVAGTEVPHRNRPWSFISVWLHGALSRIPAVRGDKAALALLNAIRRFSRETVSLIEMSIRQDISVRVNAKPFRRRGVCWKMSASWPKWPGASPTSSRRIGNGVGW